VWAGCGAAVGFVGLHVDRYAGGVAGVAECLDVLHGGLGFGHVGQRHPHHSGLVLLRGLLHAGAGDVDWWERRDVDGRQLRR